MNVARTFGVPSHPCWIWRLTDVGQLIQHRQLKQARLNRLLYQLRNITFFIPRRPR